MKVVCVWDLYVPAWPQRRPWCHWPCLDRPIHIIQSSLLSGLWPWFRSVLLWEPISREQNILYFFSVSVGVEVHRPARSFFYFFLFFGGSAAYRLLSTSWGGFHGQFTAAVGSICYHGYAGRLFARAREREGTRFTISQYIQARTYFVNAAVNRATYFRRPFQPGSKN